MTAKALVPLDRVARHHSGNSKLIKGKLHDAPADNLFPAFSATGQDVWRDAFDREGDAIIISAVGARCGKCFLARGRWSAIANTHVVWPDPEKADIKFLWYLLNDEQFWIRSGSAQPFVAVRKTFEKEIFVPPLPEQRRIVAEIEKQFTRLEAGVAALRRVQANLKRYRAAVLKAACEGRLVPTEAALARSPRSTKNGPPAYETGEALLARILTERRQNWQGRGQYKEPFLPATEKLEPLPEGWCWLSVETVAFVTKLAGFEYTKFVKYDPDGDLAVIKAENAGLHGFKRTNFSRVKRSTVAELTRSQLKPGDLLMVFVGNVGNVARVPDDQPYFLGPNIAMMRVAASSANPAYLEMFLRSPVGRSLAMGFVKAVAQPSLSMGTIRMIPVALPPLAEQTRIVAKVERRWSGG